ncbi:MAG TPA: carboxylesterase/lipase family protein, partial [Woeseiaceae bacterium]|nr:carboxylesterase/lipase family protein [Woeseiaceae bacterium]
GAVGLLGSRTRSFAIASSANPLAITQHGDVRGYSDNSISVFKGIRYAADTRERRFMPPQHPEPWTKAVDAFEYGAAAPQDQGSEPMSEDCLFLNVWTPGLESAAKRPVLFYIHGGAYSHGSGSSPLYDGAELARRGDVVVVTVNHRLNALGYLYLQRFDAADYADSGNVGQLDLVLALQWVRQNIANFGGDPLRVLAFGQSGGGAKIATMMAMPAAKDLFQRAATMSGQQVTVSGPANAKLRTAAYTDAIGIAADDVESLRSMPLDKLLAGLAAADPVLHYGSVYFGPVLDMRSLTRHPFYPDAAGQSAHIPMIIGNTRDETRAFLRDPRYYELRWEELPELLIPNLRVDIPPEFVIAEYRRIYPGYSASQVFFAATTAARSWRAAIIEAEERAKQGRDNTFVYQLDWPSPLEPHLGAPHTLDIPLVFGNLDAEGSITGTGSEASAVSAMMSDAFIAMARDGKPRSAKLPDWNPYTLAGRETMIMAMPPRMENDPRGAERRLFERVPYIQPGS